MRRFFTTIISILVFSIQFISISFGQGTKIISLQNPGMAVGKICSYDYVSHKYDTLYNIPGETWMNSEECAIDAINGRYFVASNITGYPEKTVFIYDINANTLNPLFQLKTIEQGLEYDCFSNSLIFRDTKSLKSYDIATGITSTVFKFPEVYNASYAGYCKAYNQATQQLIYYIEDMNFKMHYYLIDVSNGAIIKDQQIPTSDLVHFLTCDQINNTFYGLQNEGFVVKFNPAINEYIPIAQPPVNYNGILNEQKGIFDTYNGIYLSPYYDTSGHNSVSIIDVNQLKTIANDTFPRWSSYNCLNSVANCIIKKHDDYLLASFGSSYQWYIDDKLISNATTQKYTPIEEGNYKVKETHPDGRNTISNIIYVKPVKVSTENPIIDKLSIYPNPFSASAILKINRELQSADLIIYDYTGKEVMKLNKLLGKEIRIDRGNLLNGMYTIQLIENGEVIGTGSILIIDK